MIGPLKLQLHMQIMIVVVVADTSFTPVRCFESLPYSSKMKTSHRRSASRRNPTESHRLPFCSRASPFSQISPFSQASNNLPMCLCNAPDVTCSTNTPWD
jgi:hypothetical protein